MYQNLNSLPVNWQDTFSKTDIENSSTQDKKDSPKHSSSSAVGDGQNLPTQFDQLKFERLAANSLFLGPSPTQAHKFIPRAVQCINCGNMAKNFLYLEAFLKINTQHKKCSTCSAVLSHLTYWNKNMEEVFKSINNYVQKAKENEQKNSTISNSNKPRSTSGVDINNSAVNDAPKKKSKKKEYKKNQNKKEPIIQNNELVIGNKTPSATNTKLKKVAVPDQMNFDQGLGNTETVAGGDSKTNAIVKTKQSKKKKNSKSVAGGDSSEKAVSKTKRRKLNSLDKSAATKSAGKFEAKRGKPKKKKMFI